MPADFYIDTKRRMVFSNATGVVALGDALSHMDRLSHHPDFRPEFNQIFDFRQVTEIALSNEDVQKLAKRNIFAAESRRAFLVTPGLQFGVARMFAAYRVIAGEQGINIFTDGKEARSWVSLPEDT
jgi:hypothetical protein